MLTSRHYKEATLKTAADLNSVAQSSTVCKLSTLTLPEIKAISDLVAQVVPAGNVPAMILHGLAKLREREFQAEAARRDVNLLFRGVEQTLDRATYVALFAGPAAVIWGYQNLLRLVGKGPEDAFPEGIWQFYADYALREDTARHTNETHGFDTVLNQHQIALSPTDRLTAWVMTAIHCIHQYPDLLANEWYERRVLFLLNEVTQGRADSERYTPLYREWERLRPYGRGSDSAPADTYPQYRRMVFNRFIERVTTELPAKVRRRWLSQIHEAEASNLSAYQRQMSILNTLDPGPYGETRIGISIQEAQIGIIVQGHYTLIPVCKSGTNRPAKVGDVRSQITRLLADPPGACDSLSDLALLRRRALADIRKQLNRTLDHEIDRLKTVPIVVNADRRMGQMPLSDLRQTERGIGSHALTILDTGSTFVFDQSHIFFDGAWGAALAEILTNEALSWASYLHTLPPAKPAGQRPYTLDLHFQPEDVALIRAAPRAASHVSAESDRADIRSIRTLCKQLRSRNTLLHLTVNDLLILYRAIHAATYLPDAPLIADLKRLSRKEAACKAALEALDPVRRVSGAILIPVDASFRDPRDRLFPVAFEIPLEEMDILNLHQQVIAALDKYESAQSPKTREAHYKRFAELQKTYLSTLAKFGAVMSRAKELASTGGSTSTSTIKLLAFLPTPLQRLLDQIPGHFDILNDMIKGREVFSNMGEVVPTSTLVRFTSAKDDNDKKTLVWGVITDSTHTMHISLRDFRPHVQLLMEGGLGEFAERISQDYLDAYVRGLNNFTRDLQRITMVSRENHLHLDEGE